MVATVIIAIMTAVDPDEARDRARDIVGQRRFRGADLPRPFKGPLEWLGDRLQPIADAIGSLLDSTGGRIFFAFVLVTLGVLGVVLLARHRRGAGDKTGASKRGSRAERDLDPAALEREADTAERAGDLERALRLRFLAGLLRLERAGVITYRSSITSGEVGRRLRLAPYDTLARTHDEVVYGGRPPRTRDLDESRNAWPEVLSAVRS